MQRTLEVEADLAVDEDGEELMRLRADGAVVQLNIPSLRAASKLARQTGLTSSARRGTLARAGDVLVPAGLLVEIRIGRGLVARVGVGARAGLLSRLAGVPGVELRPLGIFGALIKA